MSNRPLSENERATWMAIKRLSGDALAAVGRDIEAATALSGADFSVLTRLEDLGEGHLSQAALRMSLAWEKSRLSHQLTRMESRRLVERMRCGPRTAMIHIRPAGRERVALARPVHAAAIRKYILQHISADEALMLARIVERLAKP